MMVKIQTACILEKHGTPGILHALIITALLKGPLVSEEVVQGLAWSHLHPCAGEGLGKVINFHSIMPLLCNRLSL